MQILAPTTTRRNAKLHADVAGRAHCGSGNGATITSKGVTLAEVTNADQLCKRCLKPIRAAIDAELRQAGGGGRSQYRQTSVPALRTLRKAIQTPDEYRASIEFQDKIRAEWVAPPAPVARKNAFAEIAAAHAAANQPRQLALVA